MIVHFLGPGIRYLPENVWRSEYFWIAVVVMIVGILLYHNGFFGNRRTGALNSDFRTEIKSLVTPKISYSSDGRSGQVHYQSAETRFSLYYEFGGGTCVASIAIPDPENWQKQTKVPLARRDEVLDSIGRQVVKDQTTGGRGYFKIEGDWINIYV